MKIRTTRFGTQEIILSLHIKKKRLDTAVNSIIDSMKRRASCDRLPADVRKRLRAEVLFAGISDVEWLKRWNDDADWRNYWIIDGHTMINFEGVNK
jgi:hypothetical protein